MAMPTATRRYQLHLLMNENRVKKEHYESMSKQNSSGGRGTRTTTVSGEALKAKLKSGEIKG